MFENQNQLFDLNHVIWKQLPKLLNLQSPTVILKYAQRNDNVRLSLRNTMAVADIRHLGRKERSLVIDAHRGIISTSQLTSQLIRAQENVLIYEHRRIKVMVAEQLGYSHTKLPIIQNQFTLCPLGAVTRESTNWFGMYHLSSYTAMGKMTRLEFDHQVSVIVPKSYRTLRTQMMRTQ
ncbi:hypothetical protein [Lactiplantibacillus carotarum]|uniref:hypothetical protein n=1 Tax=Lactiplantibacillus carotarum TaxID=2993456 RepID=UPI00298ED200|nr:hypothetical protein [Lactiplantibacillus carotarum]